jgi:hypothetical protein
MDAGRATWAEAADVALLPSGLKTDLPQVVPALFRVPDIDRLQPANASPHPPRFLLLYCSMSGRLAKAFMEFDEAGRMKPSAYFDGVVDVTEALVKFTLLTRVTQTSI